MRHLTLIAALGLSVGCAGRRPLSPLDRLVTPAVVTESGPLELFPICSEIKMPCGWEMLPSHAGRLADVVENSLEADTGRSFLERLIKRHPGYRWFLMGNVVNVVPRDIGANNPLDRQVWVDLEGVAADVALERLVASAGLRLAKRTESPSDFFGGSRFGRVTLKAQGLRLRLALNRLVAADGQSAWWCAPTRDPDEVKCGLLTWRTGVR